MVPGLKKMDKSSVIGDCIKFVEHLQARVKTLEEQTLKKTMESAVFINNFHVNSDAYLTGETSVDSSYQSLPEIQARISDDNVYEFTAKSIKEYPHKRFWKLRGFI